MAANRIFFALLLTCAPVAVGAAPRPVADAKARAAAPVPANTPDAAAVPPPAAAPTETLREALAAAYLTNPELAGSRAGLRALDEGVAQAEALKRPTLSGTVGVNQDFGEVGAFRNNGRNVSGGVNLELPLFRGGLIRNSVRAAEKRVDAGRYDLAALENDVLTRATIAYEDTRRDAEVVDLDRNQVRVLGEQLRQSRDRFEVGDLTRTDVAQSEARLANAQAVLRAAEAQLVSSQQAYGRVVGHAPGVLAPPPLLGTLPGTSEKAVDLARDGNPNLLAARASETATGYDIGVARAGRRFSLSGTSGGELRQLSGIAGGIGGGARQYAGAARQPDAPDGGAEPDDPAAAGRRGIVARAAGAGAAIPGIDRDRARRPAGDRAGRATISSNC